MAAKWMKPERQYFQIYLKKICLPRKVVYSHTFHFKAGVSLNEAQFFCVKSIFSCEK